MNIAALVNRSHPVNSKNKNYQELYEELKRNTSTFIKLVEAELSKVLLQHKKEKAWLENENQRLRQLLKEKEQNEAHRCQTYRKEESDRGSLPRYSFGENTNDIINCGISEISVNLSKSILTDRKKTSFLHFALQDKSQKSNVPRETQAQKSKSGLKDNSTVNLTHTSNSLNGSKENYSSGMLPPDRTEDLSQVRERLSRQRGPQKNLCKLGDKDSVSDALKKIRQKAMTPKASSNRQEPQYLQRDIIAPGMYSLAKKRT